MIQPVDTTDLAAIAAAQVRHTLFAFDYAEGPRQLARLQSLYAVKLTQLDTLRYILEEGASELRLRSSFKELVLCPSTNFGDVLQSLTEFLEQELGRLERKIVAAHLKLQEEALEATKSREGRAQYAPAVLALCQASSPADREMNGL